MRIVTGLSDQARLEVDALLGDRDAKATLAQQRTEAVGLLGAEIG
jgi:hypothetical protein